MKRTIKTEELYTSKPNTSEQMTKTSATKTFETVPSVCAPSFPTQIIILYSHHKEESGLLVLWRDPDTVMSSRGKSRKQTALQFQGDAEQNQHFKNVGSAESNCTV